MGHEIDGNRCALYSHDRIGKGTGRIINKNTGGDHSKDSTVNISQNTAKSPGNLRRFVVTQNLLKIHQLMLVWKNSQRSKMIIINKSLK